MCGAGYQPDRRIPDRSGNWSASQNVCKSRKTGFVGRPLSRARRERGRLREQQMRKGKPHAKTGADTMRRYGTKRANSIAFSSDGVWCWDRKAIIAVAHRMLIVIWKLLHEGETYTDTGCQLTAETIRRRMLKCVKGLEALGFNVTVARSTPTAGAPA